MTIVVDLSKCGPHHFDCLLDRFDVPTLCLGGLADEGPAESVLVLEQDGRVIGVAVDEVLDLVEVDAGTLASGADLPGVDPALVQSVGRHDGRVFAILDTRALVAPVLG